MRSERRETHGPRSLANRINLPNGIALPRMQSLGASPMPSSRDQGNHTSKRALNGTIELPVFASVCLRQPQSKQTTPELTSYFLQTLGAAPRGLLLTKSNRFASFQQTALRRVGCSFPGSSLGTSRKSYLGDEFGLRKGLVPSEPRKREGPFIEGDPTLARVRPSISNYTEGVSFSPAPNPFGLERHRAFIGRRAAATLRLLLLPSEISASIWQRSNPSLTPKNVLSSTATC